MKTKFINLVDLCFHLNSSTRVIRKTKIDCIDVFLSIFNLGIYNLKIVNNTLVYAFKERNRAFNVFIPDYCVSLYNNKIIAIGKRFYLLEIQDSFTELCPVFTGPYCLILKQI